jgi:hypothetical protein
MQLSAVRTLCSHGADVSCVNKRGHTPLHVACRMPEPVDAQEQGAGVRIMQILVRHGYDERAGGRFNWGLG